MPAVRSILAAAFSAAFLLPACLEAQYFGRNKVQYRAFDFDIIGTEHFDVYYYQEERRAALDAARMVERSYARLSRLLQHEFSERKPLILYASHTDFQQTNTLHGIIDESTGGVTESAKGRMILPFTGDYASFDHVLTHELVHGFQFDVILRGGVPMDATPLMAPLPLWFMEGVAEYLSVGHVDAHTESWLRDAVLTGYMRSIDEMSVRDDYLSYRFGQSLWAYIGEKWGDDVVGILLQKAPGVGIPRAFVSTLGVTLEELNAEWLQSIRARYLPQVAERERPDRFAARLTTHARLEDPWFLSPAISPDGTSMVFLSQRDGFHFDLWLADARTGEVQKKLIEGAGDAGFESLRYMRSGASFSPDGGYLALAAKSGGGDVLYVYDLARERIVRKLHYPLNGLSNPSWAPDGRRLVFTGLDGGISDLYITDLEGDLQRLTDDRYAELHPAWSPDGRMIAFTTDRGPGMDLEGLVYGEMRVALYDLDDGAIEILPHQEGGKNANPVWAPDGRSLIWVGDRTGTNDLYHFDLETRRLARITNLLSGVIAVGPLSPVLSWSRSDRLLFTYFEQAGYNIYGVDDPRALPRDVITAAPMAAGNGTDTGAVNPALPADHDPVAGGGARNADIRHVSPLPATTARERGLSGISSFYRQGAEFRPSDAPGPDTMSIGPTSVVGLLERPAHALPDTTHFELRDYRVKFTADAIGRPSVGVQVGGYYGNGVYGGSYIALSDMLGNHNILLAASINGSLSDAAFYSGYSFLKRRANISMALLQQPLYRYIGGGYDIPLEVDGVVQSVAANVFVRDVVRGAQARVSYPFDPFLRLELGASGYHYSSDVLYRGFILESGDALDETHSLDRFGYWQPQAALVFDNARFGWTGPVGGRRYRLQVSRALGDLRFIEGLVDARNYLNLSQHAVFATRLVALIRDGGAADRFGAYWGGPYFLRGYDGGSFDLNSEECEASRERVAAGAASRCPVRDQLIGSSAALLNAELRVPVSRQLRIGFLGSFPPIDAVAFFDAGIAWDNRLCFDADPVAPGRCTTRRAQPVRLVWRRQAGQDPLLFRRPLLSYGLGMRMNVFYTVLRLDYAVPLNRPGRNGFGSGIWSVSFGPSF